VCRPSVHPIVKILSASIKRSMAAGGSQSRQELKLAVAEVRRHAHY